MLMLKSWSVTADVETEKKNVCPIVMCRLRLYNLVLA